MKTLTELLSNEDRQAIRAPIDKARTLPRNAFICGEFYEYEVEYVLKESWLAVSFGAVVSNPGDIIPLTVVGIPIILVRGTDQRVRAFHNVCPYDSCEVSLRSQRGVRTIITPYHGWQYSLEGKLIGANYFDGSPNPDDAMFGSLDADLAEIPCEEWMCTLFVYLGNRPVSFHLANKAVLDHFDKVNIDRLVIGTDGEEKPMINRLTIDSNWKTVYENYSPNVYHESFVHAMYRASPHSPRVDKNRNKTYTEINDPTGFLGLCYDNSIGASFYGESKLPPILNKDGSQNSVNTISNVFPNWVTTVLGDAARISLFLPDGPETGTQIVATMFDQEAATDPTFTEDRLDSHEKGLIARREDNVICESIQRARYSPAFNTQFYSPFWDAMHYTLSNLVLDRLENGEK